MECLTVINVLLLVLSNAPPYVLDARSTLQRFEDSDIETLGRDPFAGTGLCGALLPIHVRRDVHYVCLPRDGFTLDDLRRLRKLPNLKQVRSRTALTEAQDQAVRESVPPGTWLIYNVRHRLGSATNSVTLRADGRVADEDVNGDGIVDENDILLRDEDDG
ncbi:hypothetical protein [Rhodopirellula halodulae]|uniref:hypothetical protein n=1 Tax=Rhodopirellula halodulae TaxID=2894198 RepID=UPI001E53A728|nr:hypothetical protein [Rhodopirellula sp. JC737]MCC9658809.1 hypothetical protein [Rhodopirellula sp. JC737]